MKCKNCHNNYSGNFCSYCGQRDTANNRLKFSDITLEFFDNAFNLNKGLFYTFWNLIIKPGAVGKAYVAGQRKQFTNPARYLIIAVAIQAFMDYWFLHPELTQQPDFINLSFLSEKISTNMAFWNHTLATKYSLVHNLSMILIFPTAFIVLFKRLKYNFTELLAVNFYYLSTGLLLTLSVIITCAVFGFKLPIPIIIIITMSYVIWTNMNFFKEVKFWERFMKVLIAMMLFILFRVFFVVYLLSVLFPIAD